ncbi:DUF368 domain-containing protein [Bacteriovoracaceae bacterium]|nr:DUF368 domain-containing protein [Bacteriovoracaceae bacterium]
MKPVNWTEAWLASPGPRTKKEFLVLYLKAFCMGIADLIPGVSGGTIAFITGIYEGLLDAVSSINKRALSAMLKLDFKSALSILHIRFILPVAIGILSAIFLLARLMHYLMNEHTVLTWSAFFGLIAASIVVIFKELDNHWDPKNIFAMVIGAVFAYIMVSLIPVDTPTNPWFIYLCGIIGITAMILPGLSGSFLLLILGKYEFITGAIKQAQVFENFKILVIFACGTATGLLAFSNILNWFLKHHRSKTMAFLTGILIGSMKKVWPWKEVLESVVIRGKTKIIREANVLPADFNTEVVFAMVLIFICFFLVVAMDKARHKD